LSASALLHGPGHIQEGNIISQYSYPFFQYVKEGQSTIGKALKLGGVFPDSSRGLAFEIHLSVRAFLLGRGNSEIENLYEDHIFSFGRLGDKRRSWQVICQSAYSY
jgi:hypothetical protein